MRLMKLKVSAEMILSKNFGAQKITLPAGTIVQLRDEDHPSNECFDFVCGEYESEVWFDSDELKDVVEDI